MSSTRRNILAALLASPALAMIETNRIAAQPARGLDLTPDCHDGDNHTLAQTEGPYFKPNAPLKQNLTLDTPRGEKITIGGLVLNTACRPGRPQTIVQIWHAEETGAYDTAAYRLRGYQFTDRGGRWSFSTVLPWSLCWPNPPLSRQGPKAEWSHPHYPVVLSG